MSLLINKCILSSWLTALHCQLGRTSNWARHMCHSFVHHCLCKRYIWALIKLPHIAIVARSAFSWTHFYGRAPFLFESRVIKQCKCLRGWVNHSPSLSIIDNWVQAPRNVWFYLGRLLPSFLGSKPSVVVLKINLVAFWWHPQTLFLLKKGWS